MDAETRFVLSTFSFLVWGGLVMWMCAGFTMLEAGSVRTRNASVICLKNVGLYSIACLTFYLVGYNMGNARGVHRGRGGARKGKFGEDGTVKSTPPANVPAVTLGVFIIWLGFLGFNAGSQLALGGAHDAVAWATSSSTPTSPRRRG